MLPPYVQELLAFDIVLEPEIHLSRSELFGRLQATEATLCRYRAGYVQSDSG